MIADLAAAFPGKLESLAGALTLEASEGDTVSCWKLLDKDVLLNEIGRLAPAFPAAGRSDLAVVWARIYTARLLTTIFPAVVLDRSLPVLPDQTSIIVNHETGYPAGFLLADSGMRFDTLDPFERFQPLIREHLTPFLDAVALHGKAPAKILWGNAAVTFDSFVRRAMGAVEERGGGIRSAPLLLTEAACWPDGSKNPLHEPYMPSESCGGRRVRKTCCLLYRLKPGNKLCGSCPILEKQNRRAQCATEAA